MFYVTFSRYIHENFLMYPLNQPEGVQAKVVSSLKLDLNMTNHESWTCCLLPFDMKMGQNHQR